MQCGNNDDSFFTSLGIPDDQFRIPLLGLGLQRTTYLQGFPDRVSHGRKPALLLDALQALQTSVVEREYNSLCLCHVASFLPFSALNHTACIRSIVSDIEFVNKNISVVMSGVVQHGIFLKTRILFNYRGRFGTWLGG